jgi:mono/diheme cytochrome c family protein
MRTGRRLPWLWLAVAAAIVPAPAQETGLAPARRGVAVTFARQGPGGEQTDVVRMTLLSLCVERGETATPFLDPGLFRSTHRARLTLPVRDRHRFRIEGRGSVELRVNGEQVLAGVLRPGRSLETAQPVRLQKGDNELLLEFESSAVGDGEFRLFWSGADFGFEPIAPERLSWPGSDSETDHERRRQGQALFAARHCARCHEPEERRIGESAYGELDGAGPDLRAIGARLQRDWIASWLRDPRQFRADATMPRLRFEQDRDADDLAAWLGSLGTPLPAAPFAEGSAAAGERRFWQLGCVACHVPPGGVEAAAAPDRMPLGFVPRKWHAAALIEYLQDPRRHHRSGRMPHFGLSRDEATELAAFLLTASAAPLPASGGDPERGRVLAQRLACIDCHDVDVALGAPKAPRLRNLHRERGCLDQGAAKAPDHGFDAEQIAALRSFLPFAETAPFHRSPLDYAARNLRAQRCTACHALDGEPSTWALIATAERAAGRLPPELDPVAQGVPALTWVGAKLQPSWLAGFIGGRESSPRPWLHARMPAFDRCGAAIAQGLVRAHGYGAADEPPAAVDAQAAIHGERLLAIGSGFGCVQCHALGDQPAVQVFEREGVELLLARRRLRHEYYMRWLLDPTRLDPESRMPKYADAKGRTALHEVLDGDAARQFAAIWQFLGSRLPQRR